MEFRPPIVVLPSRSLGVYSSNYFSTKSSGVRSCCDGVEDGLRRHPDRTFTVAEFHTRGHDPPTPHTPYSPLCTSYPLTHQSLVFLLTLSPHLSSPRLPPLPLP
ncbi:hypothetical protein BDR05DRAFT_141284 [Suillus weaverae]|nr:hypothetical protein BDR05DRAFT_141284 [Suillus weaverae]